MMIYPDFPSLVKLNENYLKSLRGVKAGLNYVNANNNSSILDFDLASWRKMFFKSREGRKP